MLWGQINLYFASLGFSGSLAQLWYHLANDLWIDHGFTTRDGPKDLLQPESGVKKGGFMASVG